MALFKNLTFDLGIKNPFKKKKKESTIVERRPLTAPAPIKKFRELPTVSKRLLDVNNEVKEEKRKSNEEKVLPKIVKRHVAEPPKINGDSQIKQEPKQEVMKNMPAQEGFFGSLHSHLSQDQNIIHNKINENVLNKDLFTEMQSFWKDKKDDLNKTSLNKAMKKDLMRKMEDLHKMEVDWQKLQLQHERIKDELYSKEIIIENNIRNLKKSFKKLHLSLDISPEHHFVLSNGLKLRNLQELADTLRHIDEDIYESHVNTEKNDFSAWVNDVMNLNDLSQNLKTAKNQHQMADLIENWYKIV